jgi:hypothetical protein
MSKFCPGNFLEVGRLPPQESLPEPLRMYKILNEILRLELRLSGSQGPLGLKPFQESRSPVGDRTVKA